MINEEKVIISNDINLGATIAYKDKKENLNENYKYVLSLKELFLENLNVENIKVISSEYEIDDFFERKES